MAQSKKKTRAPWGSNRKRAAAAAAGEAAARDLVDGEEQTAVSQTLPAAAPPSLGEAIENVKNWLQPFEKADRKRILKAVGVFLE